MRVGLPYLEQIRQLVPEGGWISKTIQDIVAAITSGYHTQHNADDTHGTITASGSISERGRTVAMGDWSDQAFSALLFMGTGGMTWTVSSTTFGHYHFMRIGSTCWLDVRVNGAALAGTADLGLRVVLPANLLVARDYNSTYHYINGASAAGGLVEAIAGDNYVTLYKADLSNWTLGSTVSVYLQMAVEVLGAGATVAVGAPVLSWTGTTTGSFNLIAVATVYWQVGTYSLTVNRTCTLTCVGMSGGGGGGGATGASGDGGGGGGSGAYTTGTIVTLSPGKTYTLIVGAKGTAGTSAAANGTTGGTTSLVNTTDAVTLVSLTGGVFANARIGGAGGTAATGSNLVNGKTGGNGSLEAVGGNTTGTSDAAGAGSGAGGQSGDLLGTGFTGGNGKDESGQAGQGGANTVGGHGGGTDFSGTKCGGGGGGAQGVTVGGNAGSDGEPGGAKLTFLSAP